MLRTSKKKKLYILVDKSLDPVYGCVQGGHALAQYLIEYGYEYWQNDYLIYLYGDTEYWKHMLEKKRIRFAEFHEPDLDGKLTALAVVNEGNIFRKLELVS